MQVEGFFPNVWTVSDHGNWSLVNWSHVLNRDTAPEAEEIDPRIDTFLNSED
jgi:hypothetical protein